MDTPTFPLIDLGEGLPVSRRTLNVFETWSDLANCKRLAVRDGWFRDSRKFYDLAGNVYRIVNVSPEPGLSPLQHFLTYLGFNPRTHFKVELKHVGAANLADMKCRIRELLENDPGDLLFQWTDEDEWELGLNSAKSVPELLSFITERALVDHFDDDRERS